MGYGMPTPWSLLFSMLQSGVSLAVSTVANTHTPVVILTFLLAGLEEGEGDSASEAAQKLLSKPSAE